MVLSGILFFIPNLGKVHLFDWDEINFAESAREMLVSGDYGRVQINFQPFWEKPPLFFWLQCASMKVFGISEFAARFPNAIFGILTLVTFYFIGRRMIDPLFGFLWALSYLGSILPHLYFKSGIIDPVFNYFIFVGIYFGYRQLTSDESRSVKYALLAGAFLGLATLTKGPAGLLMFLLSFAVWALLTRFKRLPGLRSTLTFALAFLGVSSLWFGVEVIQRGPWFVNEFVKYQIELFFTPVAGHRQAIYYHFVVVFFGCFPMSMLALPVLLSKKMDAGQEFIRLMRVLFWVVMILFTIVATKIVHYSSLAYFPLSFLAGTYVHRLIQQRQVAAGYVWRLLLAVGCFFGGAFVAVPLLAQHNDLLIPFLKNDFAVACLQSPVTWGGYEFVIGLVYLALILVSVLLLRRQRVGPAVTLLFYSTASCLFLFLATAVPKIDAYYQAPAINFYKNLAGKDVYVTTAFKSYAHLFYSQKQCRYRDNEEDFLLKGNIDRPAYIVTKITDSDFPRDNPECKLVGREGGYLFYCRSPQGVSGAAFTNAEPGALARADHRNGPTRPR